MKNKLLTLLIGLSVVLALVAVPLMTACAPEVEAPEVEVPEVAPPEEEEEKLVFAFVSAGPLTNVFIVEVVSGWDAVLEPFGVETMGMFADYDLAQTVNFFNTAIAAKVDGIFLFQWYDPVSFNPDIQRALDEGIEVVVMSIRYPFPPEEVPYIGIDYEVQAYVVGKYVAAQLKAEGKVSDVSIGGLYVGISSPLIIARAKGFHDALTDEGIDYTTFIFDVPEERGPAIDMIKAAILAHPEWDVLFSPDSIATDAAYLSLLELGIEPGTVEVAGFDFDGETGPGIKAGHGSTNLDEVFMYGYLAAIALYARVEYDKVVGDLPVTTVMIDQTNIDEYMD